MKSIPLIKRLLLYLFLLSITSIVLLFGGVLREYGTIHLVIFVFLIPHYIFGAIFLKTKLMIKLIVPFATALISFGNMWLMGKIGFFDVVNSDILFFLVLFFPVVLIWEIAYQILVRTKKIMQQTTQIEK